MRLKRTILAVVASIAPLSGAPAADAGGCVRLETTPAEVVLDRPLTEQRIVVTGICADGSRRDWTAAATLRVVDESVARIERGNRVLPRANGSTRLEISAPAGVGGRRLVAQAPVRVANAGPRRRWNFEAHIAPLLVRAGCSGTGCHGNLRGRGGFRLSAFGSDSEWDYSSIVNSGGRRRVDLRNPGLSLILRKPTMDLPHAGGKRFEVSSPLYRTLAAWLADGAPRSESQAEGGGRVVSLETLPSHATLRGQGTRQPLIVMARFADGTREDVTDLATISSRNEGAIRVEDGAAVSDGPGAAALLVRLGRMSSSASLASATSRAIGPRGSLGRDAQANVIDREIFGRLAQLGVAPAPAADDDEWLRRVYLDLIGRIPTPAERDRFRSEPVDDRRGSLVDRLLAGPEYPRYWRDNLNALLMGRSAAAPADWSRRLETWLAQDTGWDAIARELLLARAQPDSTKPEDRVALRFLDSRLAEGETGLDTVTRDVSRIFFGVDVQCARCHAHPDVAQWQQEVYWGIAAFFGRTYRIQVAKSFYIAERAMGEVQYFGWDQERRTAVPAFLTGARPNEPKSGAVLAAGVVPKAEMESAELFDVPPETAKEKTRVPRPRYSRREEFVRLAVGPNPFFRRAIVNRVWSMVMGRGLVEPVDQMHAGNPASHPELLEQLGAAFMDDGFRLKSLLRRILKSRAYGLSSRLPGEASLPPELFAVAATRPQNLFQLSSSTLEALGYWEQVQSRVAPGQSGVALTIDTEKTRAAFEADFAKERDELRRRLDTGGELFMPGVSQALYLSNSPAFLELIRQGGLAARLAALPGEAEVVRSAYRSVLTREPSDEELSRFVGYLRSRPDRRTLAVEQLVWALVASSEFRFIH